MKLNSELLVVLSVLVLIFLVEAGLRQNQSLLSGDVAHLETVDSIAAAVGRGDGITVLFWGNSLIGAGLDLPATTRALGNTLDSEVSTGIVRPDGTTPLEWRYLFRKTVVAQESRPDVLVLGFGPGHLRDRQAGVALSRLAAHHVRSADIPILFAEELATFESRARFMAARWLAIVALGERIRPRIMDLVVPRYTELAPILLRAPTPKEALETARPSPEYRNLAAMLSDAQTAGIRVVAIPMPAPNYWSLDPEERTILLEAGAEILDVRTHLILSPERFPDGEHLDSIGRQIFTAALVEELPLVLNRLAVR